MQAWGARFLTISQSPTLPRVALVIPKICMGGAERVIVTMANWWAACGTEVLLIGFDLTSPAFPLHEDVRCVSLNSLPSIPGVVKEWPEESVNILRLHSVLKEATQGMPKGSLPVVSFLSRMNLRTLLAARNLPCSVVVSERVHLGTMDLGNHAEQLRHRLYGESVSIVFQTKMSQDVWDNCTQHKTTCIPNPIARFFQQEKSGVLFSNPFLLGAGRLNSQKQFDRLIDAYAKTSSKHTALDLVIAGEGPLKKDLVEQVKQLGLCKKVHFLGRVPAIQPLAQRAEAFVLTSAFEGFPNVLLEAMSVGCPCISFDCATGPREIIRDGIDGFLVPPNDQKSLVATLDRFLSTKDIRNKLGQAAQDVLVRFSLDTIMKKWEKLFL